MMGKATPVDTHAVSIASPDGIEVRVLGLGATIAALSVPIGGRRQNVVLGYSDERLYRSDPYYLGATVGRYANRIRAGRFTLGGETIELSVQENGHCLHGGLEGVNRRLFTLHAAADRSSVTCRCVSPDGDQGFPGNLEILVRYEIVDDMTLAIEYTATTDRSTVVSLTNHAYFNLEGGDAVIDDHHLLVNGSQFTEVDDEMIPTGVLAAVDGSALDLRAGRRIGDVIGAHGGIDTNFVIDRADQEIALAGTLLSPKSGLRLDVHTTQPGVQVFTGQNLTTPFRQYGAICLETQNFPDAPNHPQFPSAILSPGDTYQQTTLLEFSSDSGTE